MRDHPDQVLVLVNDRDVVETTASQQRRSARKHDDPRDGEPLRRRAFEGIFGIDPRRFNLNFLLSCERPTYGWDGDDVWGVFLTIPMKRHVI